MPKIADYPEKTELDGTERIPVSQDSQTYHVQASVLMGGSSWGGITGDIANQTDLSSALSSKSDTSHDHEGTYSSAAHAHDASYSSKTHAHEGVYSSAAHAHEGTYSSAAHGHAYGAHASCHATAGGDAVTPAAIGAALTGHAHEGTYSSATHAHGYGAHASCHATGGGDAVSASAIGAAAEAHSHGLASSLAAGFLNTLSGTTTVFMRGDGAWSTTPSAGGAAGEAVVGETAFDQSSNVGSSYDFARSNHTHGTPTNPISGHNSDTAAHLNILSSASHAHEGTYSSATHAHAAATTAAAGFLAAVGASGTVVQSTAGAAAWRSLDGVYSSATHAHEGTYSSATHAHSTYAGLNASSLVYPNQLGTGTTGTTVFLRGDNTWATPPGGGGSSWATSNTVGVLSRVYNVTSSNSSAAVNLINYSVPARTLQTDRMLRFTAAGTLLVGTTAVANNFNLEFKHAGSSRWKDAISTQAAPVALAPWQMQICVAALNSSGTRYMWGTYIQSSGAAAARGLGDIAGAGAGSVRNINGIASSATFTITTGAVEAFNLVFNWAAANSSLSFVMRYGVLELV